MSMWATPSAPVTVHVPPAPAVTRRTIGVPGQDRGGRPVRHHYRRAEPAGAADVVVMRVGDPSPIQSSTGKRHWHADYLRPPIASLLAPIA